MTLKAVLQVLLVSSLSICYNSGAVGGRKLSKEEDLELEEQLKSLNKPSVKTIRTKYGDTYDCVDFYKQAAFDHPLLKNHNFHPQMKPQYMHREIEEKSPVNSIQDIRLKGGSCPTGTVPIRRTTKDDLIRAKIHASNIHPLGINKPGVYHAVVRTKSNSNKKYNGAKAAISLYNPEVNTAQYSSAQITVRNGLDFIQFGWTVNPPLYGDNRTRMFTFFKAGERCCYNTQCPGFIQLSKHVPLGNVFSPISQMSIQYTSTFSIYRDLSNGNWWLGIGNNITLIGFWPQSIFRDLKDSATYIDWGGEAYAPPGEKAPPMGGGHYVYEDKKTDAFCKKIMIVDEANNLLDAENTEAFTEDESLYTAKDKGIVDDYYRHLMFFGGPGQSQTK